MENPTTHKGGLFLLVLIVKELKIFLGYEGIA